MTQEQAARLVEEMADQQPWKDEPFARGALILAARTIRRGRHLTEAEKLANLAKAMDEADIENGATVNAALAERLRGIASRASG